MGASFNVMWSTYQIRELKACLLFCRSFEMINLVEYNEYPRKLIQNYFTYTFWFKYTTSWLTGLALNCLFKAYMKEIETTLK